MSTAAEIGEDVFPTTTKLVYVKLVRVERESENVASIGSNSKCFLYLAILIVNAGLLPSTLKSYFLWCTIK